MAEMFFDPDDYIDVSELDDRIIEALILDGMAFAHSKGYSSREILDALDYIENNEDWAEDDNLDPKIEWCLRNIFVPFVKTES